MIWKRQMIFERWMILKDELFSKMNNFEKTNDFRKMNDFKRKIVFKDEQYWKDEWFFKMMNDFERWMILKRRMILKRWIHFWERNYYFFSPLACHSIVRKYTSIILCSYFKCSFQYNTWMCVLIVCIIMTEGYGFIVVRDCKNVYWDYKNHYWERRITIEKEESLLRKKNRY